VPINRPAPDRIAAETAKCFRGPKRSALLALARTKNSFATFAEIKKHCRSISGYSLKRALQKLHDYGILLYHDKTGQIEKRWKV
jgi:hypothetical protein